MIYRQSLSNMCFVIILAFSGCATKVVHNQEVPREYASSCKIEKIDIVRQNNIPVSAALLGSINNKLNEKIKILESKTSGTHKIDLNIQITQAKIANQTATIFAGAFVGNNELNGFIIVHDHETNNIIGSFGVEIDKNYGGYSMFFNLEEAMAEEFANKILKQVTTVPL